MSIRMVAVDLDGTLFHNDKTVSDHSVKTVRRVLQNGIQVVFCTGRYLSECHYVLERLPEVRYAVTCTGALVQDLHENAILHRFSLTADEARRIYARVRPFESIVSFMAGGVVWNDSAAVERHRDCFTPALWELYHTEHVLVDDLDKLMSLWQEPVEKFYIAYPDRENQRGAQEAVKDLPFFASGAGYVDMEVMSMEADKGKSLGLLAEHLGIRRDEVAAIGDSENDAAALRYAGLSIAMGNGAEALKKMADMVAPSNEDDGVAWVLKQIMEGKL